MAHDRQLGHAFDIVGIAAEGCDGKRHRLSPATELRVIPGGLYGKASRVAELCWALLQTRRPSPAGYTDAMFQPQPHGVIAENPLHG
jgi:hypothetical protein